MSDEIDYPTICIIDFDDVRDMILGPWVCQSASTLEKGQPRDTEPGVGRWGTGQGAERVDRKPLECIPRLVQDRSVINDRPH